jgi:CRP-like cAMP-binding protein
MISGLAIKWVDAAGYLASILVFATFCMRTMIALRLAAGDLSFEPLRPFMKMERYSSGSTVFCKGDFADRMFVVSAGKLLVEEVDIELGPGDVVGEIGVFSSEQARTSTVRCLSDVELLSIAKQHLAEICFQNPAISFYLLSLITNRLLTDMSIFNDRRAVTKKQA